nr:hypothetical protein Iba_chr14bCG7350 [Ipomoea batatas]
MALVQMEAADDDVLDDSAHLQKCILSSTSSLRKPEYQDCTGAESGFGVDHEEDFPSSLRHWLTIALPPSPLNGKKRKLQRDGFSNAGQRTGDVQVHLHMDCAKLSIGIISLSSYVPRIVGNAYGCLYSHDDNSSVLEITVPEVSPRFLIVEIHRERSVVYETVRVEARATSSDCCAVHYVTSIVHVIHQFPVPVHLQASSYYLKNEKCEKADNKLREKGGETTKTVPKGSGIRRENIITCSK